MSLGNTCKECGTAIPADSPGGFCTQCLLGLGLNAESVQTPLHGDESDERLPPDQPNDQPTIVNRGATAAQYADMLGGSI